MRRAFALALGAAVLTAPPAPALAFNPLEDTYLIDLKRGSKLSDTVAAMRYGGFELSDGSPVRFDPWYRSRWTEMRVDFMTQLSKGAGILWGLSSGEKGQKYEIRPGFKLGLLLQIEPTPQSARLRRDRRSAGGELPDGGLAHAAGRDIAASRSAQTARSHLCWAEVPVFILIRFIFRSWIRQIALALQRLGSLELRRVRSRTQGSHGTMSRGANRLA